MNQAEREIRNTVERLLLEENIDVFIGYEQGTEPLRTSPCIVLDKSDVQKLIWNGYCSHNLAVYIHRFLKEINTDKCKRIGILCKGCDSRSVVELIKENQIQREQLYIIGISCSGMVDFKKIIPQLNGHDIEEVDETGGNITIKLKNEEKIFPKEECLYASCHNCSHTTPVIYDMLIRTSQFSPQATYPDPSTKKFANMTREKRWKTFETEITKCIRCYACRNACPNCYCNECFAEQTKPKWCGITNDISDLMLYHIIRIFHQAGRCVDCGACTRVCPMNIDLRLFTRMLVDEVKKCFDYEPGMSTEQPNILATYKADDKQEYLTELG